MALRTRWLSLARTDDNRAWAGLDLQFTSEERAFFFASTTMIIRNGQHALFWEDCWINGRSISEIAPQLYAAVPKHRRKNRTVADALQAHRRASDIQGVIGIQEIGQYLLTWRAIESITLQWTWNASGTYTAQSAYLATFQGSTHCPAWKLTWKSWPPRA